MKNGFPLKSTEVQERLSEYGRDLQDKKSVKTNRITAEINWRGMEEGIKRMYFYSKDQSHKQERKRKPETQSIYPSCDI